MRSASMRRKFVVFSALLFLIVFICGGVAFTLNMGQIMKDNTAYELSKTVELERIKLENKMNGEIALVRKMANSPLFLEYFEHFDNPGLRSMVLEEMNNYRQISAVLDTFWVRVADKKFYLNGIYTYDVNPEGIGDYWYNMTLNETKTYNFNINYNPDLEKTNIWINAPLLNHQNEPIAIVGTGVDLTSFIDGIYRNYTEPADLYFFNAAGEITGAKNAALAAEKKRLDDELGPVGTAILAKAANLEDNAVENFEIEGSMQRVAAIGKAPALGWYVVAVQSLSLADTFRTPMAGLFLVMMFVVMAVMILFNLFVSALLEPFDEMVQSMSRIAVELDMSLYSDETSVLGSFFVMAITDPLTGLYNRRFMEGRLNKLIKKASRTHSAIGVLMIDIDHFKDYNDTYGHGAGDRCIKTIADLLRQNVKRGDDFAARYGGEEFIVVLPDTDSEGIRQVADNLLRSLIRIAIPHEASKTADYVTISVGGVSALAEHTYTGADYIQSADQALYVSKENGRNRYTQGSFPSPHLGQ